MVYCIQNQSMKPTRCEDQGRNLHQGIQHDALCKEVPTKVHCWSVCSGAACKCTNRCQQKERESWPANKGNSNRTRRAPVTYRNRGKGHQKSVAEKCYCEVGSTRASLEPLLPTGSFNLITQLLAVGVNGFRKWMEMQTQGFLIFNSA